MSHGLPPEAGLGRDSNGGREPRHVVVAGGGVAGIEALLALRALGGRRLRITLLAPERSFLYRPVTVGEPFRHSEARGYDLAEIVGERPQDRFLWGTLRRVEPAAHRLVTVEGDELAYDALIVATGARATPPVPGALTFRGREDVEQVHRLLEDLTAGRLRSVAFALASERAWPLPLYELALMTGAHLRARGTEPGRVWLVTPEEEALALFGPAAARALEPLLRSRGVILRTQSRPVAMHRRTLSLAGGGEIHVDQVVTLPVLEGHAIDGLPHDGHGFIPVDAHGRVHDCKDVYAAGDATSFPLKQGGLAAQQADAAAEAIAAAAGAPVVPRPFAPVLRGLLMTGGAPLYLRAEPHRLPRATSVAIEATPLRRSGREASAAAGQPLWWPPAKVAGRYLSALLSGARPAPLDSELLTDRVAVRGDPATEAEHEDALELALLLADCDARWGDLPAALEALEAAEALQGSLPPEYEAKRRRWLAGEPEPAVSNP